MSINKRRYCVLIIALIAGFCTISLLPKDIKRLNTGNDLRVGAGDDTSGLLLKQIIKISKDMGIDTTIAYEDSNLEAYEFQDC